MLAVRRMRHREPDRTLELPPALPHFELEDGPVSERRRVVGQVGGRPPEDWRGQQEPPRRPERQKRATPRALRARGRAR
eukprot:15444369-Alexandrium_andersonii.AAC.1